MELRPHQTAALQEDEEVWVELKDFPDYFISNHGRVYSWKRNRLLKPHPNPRGYLHVCFSVNGVVYIKRVHRLVAETFIPGWDFGLEVNHIDGVKTNNHETNLEWVTSSENRTHAYRLGLQPINRRGVRR